MKKILTGLLIMIGGAAMAQYAIYTKTTDRKNGEPIYNGRITFDDLNKEPAFTWLRSGSEAYKPDREKIGYLQSHLSKYTIVVFLGTWCGDSRDLIPKFEKVLKMLDYSQSHLFMYGVDRDKATTSGEHKTYSIKFVPTIILFEGDKEVGRITESVDKSIEADLATIIKKAKATHNE